MHLKVQEGKGKRKVSEERCINPLVTSPLRTGNPVRRVKWVRAITDSVWLRECSDFVKFEKKLH